MNQILLSLGFPGWKPYLIAVLLPPLPLLVLTLLGAWVLLRARVPRWRACAALVVGLAAVTQALLATPAVGRTLVRVLVQPPVPLDEATLQALRNAPGTAIAVVGAGRPLVSPDYGAVSLKPDGIERLRYGVWVARRTGLPLGYSGGAAVMAGLPASSSEAGVARRVAEQEFGHPLQWIESESTDSRSGADNTVALLRFRGIQRIVLVTHHAQMPRTLANFRRAAQPHGVSVLAAPMGSPSAEPLTLHGWIPSPLGFEMSWLALHEWLGRLAGA